MTGVADSVPSPPDLGRVGRRSAISSAAEFTRLGSYVVFNLAAFLLIIHFLPKADMGWYALVNVVVNLASVLADLQMEKVAVRRISQQEPPSDVIGAALGIRLTGSVLATLATQAIFLVIGAVRGEILLEVQLGALIASSQFFGEALFVGGAAFQAQLRAYLDSAPRIVFVVLRFALTVVLLELAVPWWALFFAWLAAYVVADALALVLLRVKARLPVRPRISGTSAVVREALALGIAGLLGMATVQFGTVYLGFVSSPKTIAVFNVAILPIQYLSLFGGVVIIVAFPLLSRAWGERDAARFARIDSAARTGVLVLFLPVSVLLFVSPLDELMEKVFGDGYGEAATPLRLMSIALILASIMVWAGFAFLAVGRPRLIILTNLVCLSTGIAASPFIVPRWGIDGLGAIGIGATALGLLIAAVLLRRETPASFDARGTVRGLAAGAVLWGALTLVRNWNDSALLLIAACVVIYPALVLAFRVFPSHLLTELRSGGPGSGHGPGSAVDAASASSSEMLDHLAASPVLPGG